MKKGIIIIICLLLPVQIYCNNTIKGYVKNGDGEALPYASIFVINENDSSFINGTICNEEGHFKIDISATVATIKVTCIGYKERIVKCASDELVIITLEEDNLIQKGVVVKGGKTIYKLEGDALQVSVNDTFLEKLGSAEDVIERLPGINKQPQGYEVFGKGTPVIFINNRKVYDLSELTRLKASDIKNVSIIYNPGSRYGASVNSVILIKTKRSKGEGLGGMFQSQYRQSEHADFTEIAQLIYRKDKFDLFDMLYLVRKHGVQKSEINQYIKKDSVLHQDLSIDSHSKATALANTIGFNYQFGNRHSIGMRYNLQTSLQNNGTYKMESNVWSGGNLLGLVSSQSDNKTEAEPKHEINAYYKGIIGKVSAELDMDYIHDSSDGYSDVKEASNDFNNREVISMNHVANSMFAAKMQLGWNIGKIRVNLGEESIHTVRKDNYVNEEGTIPTSFSKLRELQISPFMELSGKYKFLMMSMGLRYEYVGFDYYEGEKYQKSESKSFSNLYPSFSVNGKKGKTQFLLSYSMKTKRPSYRQLSNNIIYLNRFTLQTGNPRLLPERIHDVTATVIRRDVQLTVSYKDRRDAIINVIEQYNGSAITVVSLQNEKTLKSFSAMVTYSHRVGLWNPKLSVGIRKQWYHAETGSGQISFNKPVGNVNFTNIFNFPKDWLLSFDCAFRTKGDEENTHLEKTITSFDLSISKSFFKKALYLELKATDLTYDRTQRGRTLNTNIEILQYNKFATRALQLTLRYNFNLMKGRYLGTNAGKEERNRLK